MSSLLVLVIAIAIVLLFAWWKRKAVANMWKIEDLRAKIAITLGFVAIYRFGTQVVLPGSFNSFFSSLVL